MGFRKLRTIAAKTFWWPPRRDPYLIGFRRGRWRWPHLLAGVFLGSASYVAVLLFVLFLDERMAEASGRQAVLSRIDFDELLVIWKLETLIPYVLIFVGAAAAILVLYLYRGASFAELFWNERQSRKKDFFLTFGAWFCVALLWLLWSWIAAPGSVSFLPKGANYAPWLVLGALVILCQTLGEEMMFRGYLVRALGAVLPYRLLVTLVISIAFTWIHASNTDVSIDPVPALISFWMLDLVYFWITFRTRSIAGAWGLHFANNFCWAFVVGSSPGYRTDSALFIITDPILAGGGSHIFRPAYYINLLFLIGVLCALLAHPRSPFYLEPARDADDTPPHEPIRDASAETPPASLPAPAQQRPLAS